MSAIDEKEAAVHHFVRQNLDASLASLSHEQKERLRVAREKALSHQRRPLMLARLAGVGPALHLDLFAQHALAKFAMMLAIAGAAAFWHANTYIDEMAEVDSAILTDEMPIDIITDKGFNEWLLTSATE